MEKVKNLLSEKDKETVGFCFSISPEENSEGGLEHCLKDCIRKAINYINDEEVNSGTDNPLSEFGAYISLVRRFTCHELPKVSEWILETMDENQEVVGIDEPLFVYTNNDINVLDLMIAETIEEWVKKRNVKFKNLVMYNQVYFRPEELEEAIRYLENWSG